MLDVSRMRWYRCHKEVHAAKIVRIEPGRADRDGPGATIISAEGVEISLSEDYVGKHHPQEGGYFVVYEDGYESYSPAKAFEDGYSEI